MVVLAFVDKQRQQYGLHGCELELSRGISDVHGGRLKEVGVKVRVLRKLNDILKRLQYVFRLGIPGVVLLFGFVGCLCVLKV